MARRKNPLKKPNPLAPRIGKSLIYSLKIAVFGDAWKSTYVIPDTVYRQNNGDKNDSNKPEHSKKCYAFHYDSGVERIKLMLTAIEKAEASKIENAVASKTIKDNNTNNPKKIKLIIPDPVKLPFEIENSHHRYGVLKKYDIAHDFEPLKNELELRELKAVYRAEHFGIDEKQQPPQNNGPNDPEDKLKELEEKKRKEYEENLEADVWIVYQEMESMRGPKESNQQDRIVLRNIMIKHVHDQLKKEKQKIPLLLWYPVDFGNRKSTDPITRILLDTDKVIKNRDRESDKKINKEYEIDEIESLISYEKDKKKINEMSGKNIIDAVDTILQNTIVFLRLDHLMQNGIARREDISVEHCLRGVIRGCRHPDMQFILKKCKAVIINSGIDLAFLCIGPGKKEPPKGRSPRYPENISVFFRYLRTDEFYRRNVGKMRGSGRMMMVSCLSKLKLCIKQNNMSSNSKEFIKAIKKGIHDGLWRMLLQFSVGYFPEGKPPEDNTVVLEKCYTKIYEKEISVLENAPKCCFYKTQDVDVDISSIGHYSQDDGKIKIAGRPFQEFSFIQKQDTGPESAKRIVVKGFEQLLHKQEDEVEFPLAHFGKLTVIDPDEIVNYRFILMQIRDYIENKSINKPLALAVFGPPGSGKSTGVVQVATAALGCESVDDLKKVECNLAQFTDSQQLAKKLHDAQDLVQQDRTPVVFLDEFDSIFEDKQFGWFKYLLPLLHDGIYKMGDSEYNLGKAIVILAGGVYHRFKNFNALCKEDHDDHKKFRAVKGPDLISRLRGIIDIKGPNPIDKNDVHYVFRRAVLLRYLLEKYNSEIFVKDDSSNFLTARIEQRVLDAFLDVKAYRHGSRSMEALIEMCGGTSSDYNTFVAAMIPPPPST